MKYVWDNPYEWLEQMSRGWGEVQLLREFLELVRHVDSDTLQDQFQDLMDEDGYFDVRLELRDCEIGKRVKVATNDSESFVGRVGTIVEVDVTRTNLKVRVAFQDDSDDDVEEEIFAPEELTLPKKGE